MREASISPSRTLQQQRSKYSLGLPRVAQPRLSVLKALTPQQVPSNAGLFLLSWTLTQQVSLDIGIAGRNVIGLAQNVFPGLFISDSLWNVLSKQTYSNFIMVDAWPENKRLTALVVAINKYLNSAY